AVWRTELTPLAFLERSARVFGPRTAVAYGDRRYSYAELGARAQRLGSALRRAGVGAGDRVAYLCPNSPAMLEGHYGVALAGAIQVPINVRLSADEVGYILGHSGARALVVDTEFGKLAEPARRELPALETVVLVRDTDADTTLDGPEYEAFLQTGEPAGLP